MTTLLKACYGIGELSLKPHRVPGSSSTHPASNGDTLAKSHRQEIEALFVQWGPMVLRRARAILGNDADAEEATQDVFISAMRSLDKFKGNSKVSSWLYRITTNLCLNRLRNQERRRELRSQHLSTETSSFGHGDLVAVRQLLSQVPEPMWASAAVYVFVDGMSHEEAAKLLGVSKRTVGNLLRRLKAWAKEQEQPADMNLLKTGEGR